MTEPLTVRARLVTVIIVALALLMPNSASADVETIRVFYYGLGDGYLGRKHASAHWGQTPAGFPDVVDLVHYGVATSDWSIPFGTELCLEVVAFPGWAEGEYDNRTGVIVCGAIVVDRMPHWVEQRYGESLDAWPALARRLLGSDFVRIGTATVKVIQQENKPERTTGRKK